MERAIPEDHGARSTPDEVITSTDLLNQANCVAVRPKEVVVELLEPGCLRVIADVKARREATGDRFTLDNGDVMPALRQTQGDGQAERTTAEDRKAGGHGGYIARSVGGVESLGGTRRGTLSPALMAAAGLTLTLIVVTVLFAASPAGSRWNGDLRLFHQYAGALLD